MVTRTSNLPLGVSLKAKEPNPSPKEEESKEANIAPIFFFFFYSQEPEDEIADEMEPELNDDDDRKKLVESGAKATGFPTPAKAVSKEDRTTTPYMTKYERARILGTRALQIR